MSVDLCSICEVLLLFLFCLLEIHYTSLNPIWLCNLGQLNNVSVSHSSLLKKVIAPISEDSCGS